MVAYTVVGVLVAVAAVALMFWRSGILQRNLTALEVNGTKYTAADVQYYYNSIYSTLASQYAFDPSVSVREQIYDEASGQTWHDYIIAQAVDGITNNTALAAQARSEGYVLSADAQVQRDAAVAQLDTAWISYNASSRDQFIRSSFGPYMTYGRLVELLDLEYLASDYANAKLDAIQHTDADYESYYKEHADRLDTIVYTQLAFQAQAPDAEMTDEERSAALEAAKAEQKALAEEVRAKLEAGADPADLAEEYADELYSTALSRRSSGSNAGQSNYGSWLMDPARRAGDITLQEYDSGAAYYYYVARFEERLRDDEELHNVRHILIRAGEEGSTPTQAQYDEAEEKARALLDEWRAGEASESSFIDLVAGNSQDPSTISAGGLCSGLNSHSDYAEPFLAWALDPARVEGEADLVRTQEGWHVMFYSATRDPQWKQTAASALTEQDYDRIAAEATQGWTATQGMGMRFVSAR